MKPRGIADKSAIRIGRKPVAEEPISGSESCCDGGTERLPSRSASGKGTRTFHDVKNLHAGFSESSDLKQIQSCSRLERNATYIDLIAATAHEFTATADHGGRGDHRYALKSEVPYEVWLSARERCDSEASKREKTVVSVSCPHRSPIRFIRERQSPLTFTNCFKTYFTSTRSRACSITSSMSLYAPGISSSSTFECRYSMPAIARLKSSMPKSARALVRE
jgi:hypothetical protein